MIDEEDKKLKKEIIKEFYVTPCCKTRHYYHVNQVEYQGFNVIRCEYCEEIFDGENLEKVIKGLNPVTFFCDKCYISAATLTENGSE